MFYVIQYLCEKASSPRVSSLKKSSKSHPHPSNIIPLRVKIDEFEPFTDSRGSNTMNEPTNHSRARRVAKYSVTKTATRVFCGRHCYLLNDQKKIRNEKKREERNSRNRRARV